MINDTHTRYTKVAIGLHWLIALCIVAELAMGIVMGNDILPQDKMFIKFQIYQVHKSLGLTILILSVFRLVWRLLHRPPPYPADLTRFEIIAAKLSHYAFYFFMLAVPLLGWALVSASSRGMPTIWFGLFEWPHIGAIHDLENRDAWQDRFASAHIFLAYSMLALLAVHIAAALKHHIIDKNDVLVRMLPFLKVRS